MDTYQIPGDIFAKTSSTVEELEATAETLARFIEQLERSRLVAIVEDIDDTNSPGGQHYD